MCVGLVVVNWFTGYFRLWICVLICFGGLLCCGFVVRVCWVSFCGICSLVLCSVLIVLLLLVGCFG